MKRLSIIIVLLLILITFSSCGENTPASSTESQNNELQSRLEELERQNAELQKQIEEKEKSEIESAVDSAQDEQELIENQLAVILNTQIIEQSTQYKSLYPDMVQWILENRSGQVIKNYTVSILAYDENGYPVKIKGNMDFAGEGFEKKVLADTVNVQPDNTHGEGYGYGLDQGHGIAYAVVIVNQLEFYDSEKWENPYYTAWIKKYREKPVPLEELKVMCETTMLDSPVSASGQSASSATAQPSTPKSPAQYEEEIKYFNDIADD